MTTNAPTIDKFKAWSFSILIAIVAFFGVRTINKMDEISSKLEDINISVSGMRIEQTQTVKDNDRQDNLVSNHEVRLQYLERSVAR